jgi:hypothetical protein
MVITIIFETVLGSGLKKHNVSEFALASFTWRKENGQPTR